MYEEETLGVGGEGGQLVDSLQHIAVGRVEVAVFLAIEGGDGFGAGGDVVTQVNGLEIALLHVDDDAHAAGVFLIFLHIGEGNGHIGVLEDLGVGTVDIGVFLVATHFEDVLEVFNLIRQRVVAEDILKQVVLEGVELVEAVDALVGGVAGREVVLVIYHEVAVIEVLQLLELVLVGDAGTVATGNDGAVVELNIGTKVGGDTITLLLLTAGLLNGTLTRGLFLGFDALLLETAVLDAHATHQLGKAAQTVVVDGIVGQDGVGVEPDEAVAEGVVVLNGGEHLLGLGAERDTEVGQRDIFLRLVVEIAHGGGGIVDPSRVEAVVAYNVTNAKHRRGWRFRQRWSSFFRLLTHRHEGQHQ